MSKPERCETTMTMRYPVDCKCGAVGSGIGPCVHWEPELGAVVNGRCSYCDHIEACHHIAGAWLEQHLSEKTDNPQYDEKTGLLIHAGAPPIFLDKQELVLVEDVEIASGQAVHARQPGSFLSRGGEMPRCHPIRTETTVRGPQRRAQPSIRFGDQENMSDPLKPSASLLCKLGSIVVHAEELISSNGHAFDRHALEQLTTDLDVMEWRAQMDAMAMIPKKR